MTKTVNISFSVDVSDDADEEALACELEKMLASRKADIEAASAVVIGRGPRIEKNGTPGGGYEGRIWSKATC